MSGVGPGPSRVHHRLASCLDDVSFQARTKMRHRFLFQGPRAKQSLVQEVLFVAVRNFLRLNDSFPFLVPPRPTIEVILPLARNFREDVDSGTHVFATLGVVRGSAIQAIAPAEFAFSRNLVEVGGDDGRRARVSAYFVERKKGAVNIENGVFQALGDNRTRELLPAHDECQARFPLLRKQVPRILEKEHIAHKIQARCFEAQVSTSRGVDGAANMKLCFGGHFHAANIGSINGETCRGFDESLRKLHSREVARIAISLSQDAELAAQVSHLGGEQSGHDKFFLLIQQLFVAKLVSQKSAISLFDRPTSAWMNKQPVDGIQIFIACRSCDGPFPGKLFGSREYFFHNHVEAVSLLLLGAGGAFLQTLQIAQRVAETVDVIDAQPGDDPSLNQLQNHSMDSFKHNRILDAHAQQIRNSEKAPIVHSFVNVLPVRQYIHLFGQQAVQAAKTAGMFSPAIEN